MASEKDLGPNGMSQLIEKPVRTNNENQKRVSISEEAQIINDERRSSYDKGGNPKKLSRQDKVDNGKDPNIHQTHTENIKTLTNGLSDELKSKIVTPTTTDDDSVTIGENSVANAKQNVSNNVNNDFRIKTRGVETVNSEASAKPSVADERLTERRKSFVPMSSMEEENLRERLHLAQLRKCNEIISKDSRYTRENFRKLFQTEVSWYFNFVTLFYKMNVLVKVWFLNSQTNFSLYKHTDTHIYRVFI